MKESIEDALEEVRKEYEYAKSQNWIHDPICYALYAVWHRRDQERKQKLYDE